MPFVVNTFTAETIALIKGQFTMGLGGISPSPVPPTASFPYVTVTEVTVLEVESLYGLSGVQQTIMQVNVWDKDYEAAGTMRDSIKAYLCGFTGTAGTRFVQGINPVLDTSLHDGVRSLHQAITRIKITWGS